MTELRMRSYRQKAALSLWTGPAIYHGIEIIPRTGLNLLRYKRRPSAFLSGTFRPL